MDLLRLLARHPHVRAEDLAPLVGLEKARFKADVRKLKTLGLTISHSPGYELSPRGSALLRALLTGDVETALGLGCRGLAEEDLSLLTQACVAGIDYGQAQREILRTIEREGL